MGDAADGATSAPAFQPPRGRAWFWVPVAPLVALDLWSKAWVFAFLRAEHPTENPLRIRHAVWQGVVDLDLVHWHNTGTIWGLFQGHNLPLVILRCVAVAVIVGYVARLRTRSRGLQFVLGLILAGALGNLFDNFTEDQGGVRDFLSFTFHVFGWNYEFPAFNVADSCITCGVMALAASVLFAGKPASPTPQPARIAPER